eukprot:gene10440-10248_t
MGRTEQHVHPPFHVWTESTDPVQKGSLTDAGCYNFLTGTGGYVQALANGYGGLRITPTGFRLRPALPP